MWIMNWKLCCKMWTNLVFAQHGLGRTVRIWEKPQKRQWNFRARYRTESTQIKALALQLESTCTVQFCLHQKSVLGMVQNPFNNMQDCSSYFKCWYKNYFLSLYLSSPNLKSFSFLSPEEQLVNLFKTLTNIQLQLFNLFPYYNI